MNRKPRHQQQREDAEQRRELEIQRRRDDGLHPYFDGALTRFGPGESKWKPPRKKRHR